MTTTTRNRLSRTAVLALLAAAGVASAQPTATFSYLPEGCISANDMSPDGRFIVGAYDANQDGSPDGSYLYDRVLGTVTQIASGLIGTGAELVNAVSDDGLVAAGSIPFGESSSIAGIWNATDGWQSCGYLPNALQCPSLSTGWELSGDGTTVVGLSWDGCDAYAVTWTEATGMLPLEHLANGGNRASVVSTDGSVIGGFCQTNDRTPCFWDGATGAGTIIDPNGAGTYGEITGMSDDGSVLLMQYYDNAFPTKDGNLDAYKWSAAGGAQIIGAGSIIGGWNGIPMDIASETGTIVGFDFLVGNRRAWIQPDGQGACQELVAFVNSHGGTVPTGQGLEVCQAISADGTTIVGHGLGPVAWIIELEYPCQVDINGDGFLDNGDIGDFIAAFLAGDIAADFNSDGFLDNGDISAFIEAFLAGC